MNSSHFEIEPEAPVMTPEFVEKARQIAASHNHTLKPAPVERHSTMTRCDRCGGWYEPLAGFRAKR